MGPSTRRFPIGAEPSSKGGVNFRVWAPLRHKVRVILEGENESRDLQPEPGGYHSGLLLSARPGSLYRFELDDSGQRFPDPASRFQPDGPHGPSQVIDPHAFAWTDRNWPGVKLPGQIVYELHLGTFSREGTWQGAKNELPELAAAGITLIEIMPVADFPGRFGWSYDGVGLFAPTWLYGRPDDMRDFVNEAHSLGIGVILDVVYNHFGPDGNYATSFSPFYVTDKHKTDWGEAINFDGEHSDGVREFFLTNVRYWISEFHLDGLRLDATQDMHDDSPTHILRDIARAAREAAGHRSVVLIAENEAQHAIIARAEGAGGYGLDGLWNDDFHHSALVALTGRNEAYYSDYLGKPQEFIAAAKFGYLYQGQWYRWQKKHRGTPAFDLPPAAFVDFIQNHDQVANSARGERPNLLTARAQYRAVTALLLLGPGTPMLFQGQEFGATTPFLFFCDHKAEIGRMVREGRARFLAQFPSLSVPEVQEILSDPGNPHTFEASKLDFSEREKNAEIYTLHKDLIALRRADPVLSLQKRGGIDGAVLSAGAFLLRYFGETAGDRLLIVNLGSDAFLDPAPEPLLAPPLGHRWQLAWSSENPKYSGLGTIPPGLSGNWRIPGNSALFLRSELSEAQT